MIRILAVLERDLRRMLRNPLSLFGAVLMPLLYLLILGNSLQGAITGLRLGVIAYDQGAATRTLLGALQAVQNGPKTLRLVSVGDEREGMQLLRQGELSGLLVIPTHFSADLSRGLVASAGLFVDNVDAVAANTVVAAVTGTLPILRQPLARFEIHQGGAEARIEEIYPRVDYDTSLVPAVVVMAIFMAAQISGGFNLVMDRFLGVHESYLSTPLKRSDIALGVLGSGTAVAMAASTIVLLAGLLATGGRVHGGGLGYVLLVLVQLLTTLGLLAMMMSLLGRATHPRMAGLIGGFLNVILFFPSGALYPIQSFPAWLRMFARVNPETHAIAALKAILFRGGDLLAAVQHVAFLGGFAAVMLLLATLTLKRTL